MKRWALRICVFLLLGAIVNVAVAWGLAALSEDGSREEIAIPQPAESHMYGDWSLVVQRRTVGKTQNWFQGALSKGPLLKDIRVTSDWRALTCTYLPFPMCGNDDSGPADVVYPIGDVAWSRLGFVTLGDRSLVIESEVATGWPSVAFWGCAAGVDRTTGEETHVGCLGFGKWQMIEYVRCRETCLPFCPLWPGFAINTLFYAGILWVLFAAPFALRRRRRIKRGLCPACAYPVGESDVCTECGTPVTPPHGDARDVMPAHEELCQNQ